MENHDIEILLRRFDEERHGFSMWLDMVRSGFMQHPRLTSGHLPAMHSMKSRIKDRDHLRRKIERKTEAGRTITPDNLFSEITDIVGIRILHLHQRQFWAIHGAITERLNRGDWKLGERPKAYSWDPASRAFYSGYDFDLEIKESYYTSVHYIIKPPNPSPWSCEVQVRTLFEEIWGEIDHAVIYPDRKPSTISREQLGVLARLISTGTRLADSIFNVLDHEEQTKE